MTNTISDLIKNNMNKLNNRIIQKDKILNMIFEKRSVSLAIIIILMSIVTSFIYPETFFTADNFKTLTRNSVTDGIVAIGMTIVFISGGFDLSVGSTMLLVAGVTAYTISFWGFPVIAGIIVGLIAAAFCGVFNGVIIAIFNVNPFITTLASMGIIRGLKEQVAGTGILVYNDFFKSISQTKLLNTQLPIFYLLFFIIVFTYFLMRNRFFRGFYYVGGNELSARISGINVRKLKITSYIFTGVFAGIAGIVMASRIGGALITTGGGIELRVITATVLGGASLDGGEGSIIGSVLGVFFMNLIHNVLIMAHISPYLIRVVFAGVLLLAVSLDVLIKRQRKMTIYS